MVLSQLPEEKLEQRIVLLKSQIFDLQIQFSQIRQGLSDKINELNQLNKLREVKN